LGSKKGTDMKTKLLYIWLQMAVGICNRVAGEVLSHFDDILSVYHCEDFSFLGDHRSRYIKRLEDKDTSSAYEVLKRCEAIKADITGYYDELYPNALRRIDTPPVALYSIGEFRDLNNWPCISVVGARKMSEYGREIAGDFAYNFAKSGAYVISGLAKGIDVSAHRGALRAGGFTVGVLGNPIGEVYPRENEADFQALYEKGLVISELYPGAPRTRADFPNRNRIISALGSAVVIAEAGEGSGALITAEYAVAQGKRVYAVPGAIGAANEGTNNLIKRGVPAVTSPLDVLEPLVLEFPDKISVYEPAVTSRLRSYGNGFADKKEYVAPAPVVPQPPKKPKVKITKPMPEPKPEKIKNKAATSADMILSALREHKMLSTDELCEHTGLSVSEVMTELTLMEIEGAVIALAGGRFSAS